MAQEMAQGELAQRAAKLEMDAARGVMQRSRLASTYGENDSESRSTSSFKNPDEIEDALSQPSITPRPDFLQAYLEETRKLEAGDFGRTARLVGEDKALQTAAMRRRADKSSTNANNGAQLHESLPVLHGREDPTHVAGDAGESATANAPQHIPESAGLNASLLGHTMTICGLLARPALNGSRGVCISFNHESGRYNVRLPRGEVIALRPSNLSDAPGAFDPTAAAQARPTNHGEESLDAAVEAPDKGKRRKASIGARMAERMNTKGVAWAKGGINGQSGGIRGVFASDERKQAVAQKAASRITEDFDWASQEEADRKAAMSPRERELERKALMLKKMATEHMGGMDLGRAISYLTDAIEMRPMMRELWSNRSYAYEMMHRHEEALSDGEKTIELAPDWPKGYLRAARALMSLERGSEATARLRKALEYAPRDETLLAAYKEARVLAECTRRTERAIKASQLPTFNGVGDEDIVGICRGACMVKGCDCNAYIQKHGRTTVLLQGRGHVRQDNDPSFFMCMRCGHDAVSHKDLRDVSKTRNAKPGGAYERNQAAPTCYTNQGGGARGGLSGSYYYAAVAQKNACMDCEPSHTPNSLDPSTVGSGLPEIPESSRLRPGEEGAHEYNIDSVAYHSWKPAARPDVQSSSPVARSACSAIIDRDDWRNECDPSLLEVDPFAAAGEGLPAPNEADPTDLSAQQPITTDPLLNADPLCRTLPYPNE